MNGNPDAGQGGAVGPLGPLRRHRGAASTFGPGLGRVPAVARACLITTGGILGSTPWLFQSLVVSGIDAGIYFADAR